MQQGKPIAYYSSVLCPKNCLLSTYEKEALAMIEALKKWRHYLVGHQLIIKTDHQSLKFMTDQKVTGKIQHKLMLKLLEFDFQIQYKKGKENVAADALSRKCQLMAISFVTPKWTDDIEHSYENDPACKKILEELLVLPGHELNNNSLQGGIIRHKGGIYVGNDKALKQRLLTALHSSALGGHSGMKATYQRVKNIFYWPGMKKEIEDFVAICPVCQKNKGEHCHYPGLLDPLHIPDMAWTHLSMDFVEGLPKSNGKEIIFVIVDRLTNFAHFIAMSHPYTVQSVAIVFIDNVIRLHGPPIAIVSDRDKNFTSHLWKEIFAAMKIELRYSSAYHPQSDGQTERVNQCIENYLRCMASAEPKKWVYHLPMAEYWYNTSFHSSLQKTPFQALYGYDPPNISEFSLPGSLEVGPAGPTVDRQALMG